MQYTYHTEKAILDIIYYFCSFLLLFIFTDIMRHFFPRESLNMNDSATLSSTKSIIQSRLDV